MGKGSRLIIVTTLDKGLAYLMVLIDLFFIWLLALQSFQQRMYLLLGWLLPLCIEKVILGQAEKSAVIYRWTCTCYCCLKPCHDTILRSLPRLKKDKMLVDLRASSYLQLLATEIRSKRMAMRCQDRVNNLSGCPEVKPQCQVQQLQVR